MVAGLAAADHLFELDADLPALATELEGHPDNVGAALRGGFVICDGPDVRQVPAPDALEAVLVVPAEAVATSAARAALPEQVPIADAVANVASAATLTLGLATSDWDLISAGLRDRLHQPYRAHLYPRAAALLDRARGLGALGATISGAGPTVLVWCRADQTGPGDARPGPPSARAGRSCCAPRSPPTGSTSARCSSRDRRALPRPSPLTVFPARR